MEAFQFYSPTQIIFGRGTEEQVGEQIARRGGSRVLVVYGGQSAVKSELLSRVLASLEQSGLSCDTLGGVKPNPRLSLVLSGIQRAEAFQANFLLAIGGGSVIDTAKAIADGVANPELDLWDDLWMKKVPLERSLPVGVVLTIPAAGSESSDSAVLTKDDTLEKRGLGSDLHRPRFAILNPDLTATRWPVAWWTSCRTPWTATSIPSPPTNSPTSWRRGCFEWSFPAAGEPWTIPATTRP